MFLHLSVILFMGGGMCGRGHAWQGGMHGRGACVAGTCVAGGMHGRGACMAGVCVAGGGHAWQILRDPTGMHSCFNF